MRKRLSAFVLSVSFLASVLAVQTVTMTGCQSTGTPAGDNARAYLNAESSYSHLVQAWDEILPTAFVTKDQAIAFESARVSANNILDRWRVAVVAGQPFDGWASLDSILTELTILLASAQTARTGAN